MYAVQANLCAPPIALQRRASFVCCATVLPWFCGDVGALAFSDLRYCSCGLAISTCMSTVLHVSRHLLCFLSIWICCAPYVLRYCSLLYFLCFSYVIQLVCDSRHRASATIWPFIPRPFFHLEHGHASYGSLTSSCEQGQNLERTRPRLRLQKER